MSPLKLFFCYSHVDKNVLNDIERFINKSSCPNVEPWTDKNIYLGEKWDDRIQETLKNADIIVLLVSQDFLNSQYINAIELEIANKRNGSGLCEIIPVLIRPSTLSSTTNKEIYSLESFPKDKNDSLSNLSPNDRENKYKELNQKINAVAAKILDKRNSIKTDENIQQSIKQNDESSKDGQAIVKLRTATNIFLSIPDSAVGMNKRKGLIYQAEGKKKHEKWPYNFVPDLTEAEAATPDNALAGQPSRLLEVLSNCIYSIHIFSNAASLENGFSRLQYDYAIRAANSGLPYKKIIWLLDPALLPNLSEEMKKNPVRCGGDLEDIFETIQEFDSQKEQEIQALIQHNNFSPRKKVYMLYLPNDHNNALRIKLKTKIEENKNISLDFSIPESNEGITQMTSEMNDLKNCDGAVIFYGEPNYQWFCVKQKLLLNSSNLKSRAVCIDEPDIDIKMHRDIRRYDFETTIKGEDQLETGVNDFVDHL